jgi:NADPH2:quinone reductase
MRLTNNKGVQGVFDGVGADTWEENFDVTAIGATIVTFGNASGPVPAFSPLKLSPKCLKVTRPTLFPFISTPESFKRFADDVTALTEQGVLKVRRKREG